MCSLCPCANTSLTALPGYTEAINLLNYSTAVIPVTRADMTLDVVDESYRPLNATDKRNWEACRFSWCRTPRSSNAEPASDDPEVYHGASVGVQLVARKFEEEKIWAIANIATAALETAKAEMETWLNRYLESQSSVWPPIRLKRGPVRLIEGRCAPWVDGQEDYRGKRAWTKSEL